MSRDKILDKVLSGSSDRNIRFQELRKVLFDMDFQREYMEIIIYTRKRIYLTL